MLAAPQVKRYPANAEVAKLVDALDLGSSALRCAGSSPALGTKGMLTAI
jgi:hypothetical protein